jgi:hypothetical protein
VRIGFVSQSRPRQRLETGGGRPQGRRSAADLSPILSPRTPIREHNPQWRNWVRFALHTSYLKLQTSPHLALFVQPAQIPSRRTARIGFVLHNRPPDASRAAPNWVRFAHLRPPDWVRFVHFAFRSRSAKPNWVCFAQSAIGELALLDMATVHGHEEGGVGEVSFVVPTGRPAASGGGRSFVRRRFSTPVCC